MKNNSSEFSYAEKRAQSFLHLTKSQVMCMRAWSDGSMVDTATDKKNMRLTTKHRE